MARGAADKIQEWGTCQKGSLSRDHARGGAAGNRQRGRDRRAKSRRAAGAPGSRPTGRLQGQSGPLENREEGDFGGTRSDRGASASSRAREGNPRVQAGRVLDGRGVAGKRQAAVHREAASARRQEAGHQQRNRSQRDSVRAHVAQDVRGHGSKASRAAQESWRAIYDEHTAAGRGEETELWLEADDATCAGSL